MYSVPIIKKAAALPNVDFVPPHLKHFREFEPSPIMSSSNVTQPSQDNPQRNAMAHLSHSVSITSVAEFTVQDLEPCRNVAPRGPFADHYSNFCSASAGAKTLFATDDWFATADNLLKDGPPLFIDDLFCTQGKVMDGWETRRRREAGNDWCLIKLSSKAKVWAVELDTAHFTGNNTPRVSIEIADVTVEEQNSLVRGLPGAFERLLYGGVQGTGQTPTMVAEALEAVKVVEWKELLPETPLRPGFDPTRMHYFKMETPVVGSLIRVNYFPDGGVARLRLWGESQGEVMPTPPPQYMPIKTGETCTVVAHSTTDSPPSRNAFDFPELSSQDEGGVGVSCSNKHYGEPWRLTQKSLGKDMGDGWETARHPCRPPVLIKDPVTHLIDSPLMDWAILKLGKEAANGVARVILDTRHFRGNYPESVLVEGCFNPDDSEEAEWFTVVPRTRMSPDSEHVFDRTKDQVHNSARPITHVRVSIYPDGGISRVRIYG
jgi:allantoicase